MINARREREHILGDAARVKAVAEFHTVSGEPGQVASAADAGAGDLAVDAPEAAFFKFSRDEFRLDASEVVALKILKLIACVDAVLRGVASVVNRGAKLGRGLAILLVIPQRLAVGFWSSNFCPAGRAALISSN